ncbi:uncharacterized protein [Temnothorax longispinosus]|uniref:uncharacterized protein n=1 Tax=Temnothorax longispinosus TaxID=300112 RepID=UPI003A99F0D6
MGNGKFWYKGIGCSVVPRLSEKYLSNRESIQFDINIDGLESYPSSRDAFWPILGCLVDEKEPFIIAVYHGEGKPPLEPFLPQFVDELSNLMINGIMFQGTTYRVQVRNFVLDAPARAFIKCIKGHTSRKACEKCHITGVRYKNREVFLDHDACLRNDEEFRSKVDADHHIPDITSPLEEIGIGMVSQFRLDEMHLLYSRVFQRWLEFVLGKRGPNREKISPRDRAAVSAAINEIKPHIPVEFCRRPRNLSYFGKYKASEFRRILLYDGIKIFSSLGRNLYTNYLFLQCGVYILSSPLLLEKDSMIETADVLLRAFIRHAADIFGNEFVTYYIHVLCHLPTECHTYQALSNFSAFKYENYLGVIKRCLRATYMPLQQLYNRNFERGGRLMQKDMIDEERIELSKKHYEGDDEVEVYSKLTMHGMTLSTSEADCCFQSKNGEVVVLSKITCPFRGTRISLHGHRFKNICDFFTFPINSTDIGICKVSQLEETEKIWPIIKFFRNAFSFLMPMIVICVFRSFILGHNKVRFSVVVWPDGGTCVVATKWLNESKETVVYPSKTKCFTRLVMSLVDVKEDWEECNVDFLHSYKTFNLASKAAKLAAEDKPIDSNIKTDYEKPRKRPTSSQISESEF